MVGTGTRNSFVQEHPRDHDNAYYPVLIQKALSNSRKDGKSDVSKGYQIQEEMEDLL